MITPLADKVKGFLTRPIETFRQSADDDLGTVFTYFVLLLLVGSLFSALVTLAGFIRVPFYPGIGAGVAIPVLVFFTVLIGEFIFTLVFAAWLHLWVYLLGGRKGIMQTARVVIYGDTPGLLLGWIPFLGFVFTIWALVLGVLGIRELQGMNTKKAALVVVIAVIVPLIVIGIIVFWFPVSFLSMTPLPAPPANALII